MAWIPWFPDTADEWWAINVTPTYEEYAAKLEERWGYIYTNNIAPVWIGEFGANFTEEGSKGRDGVDGGIEYMYLRKYVLSKNSGGGAAKVYLFIFCGGGDSSSCAGVCIVTNIIMMMFIRHVHDH